MKLPFRLSNMRLTIALKIFLGFLGVVLLAVIVILLLLRQIDNIVNVTNQITRDGYKKKTLLANLDKTVKDLSGETRLICLHLTTQPLSSAIPGYEREMEREFDDVRRGATKGAALTTFTLAQSNLKKYLAYLDGQAKRLDRSQVDEAVLNYNSFGFGDSIQANLTQEQESLRAESSPKKRASGRNYDEEVQKSLTELAGLAGASRAGAVRNLQNLYDRMRLGEKACLNRALAVRRVNRDISTFQSQKEELSTLIKDESEKPLIAQLDSLFRATNEEVQVLTQLTPRRIMETAKRYGNPVDHEAAAQIVSMRMSKRFSELTNGLADLFYSFLVQEQTLIDNGLESLAKEQRNVSKIIAFGGALILLSLILAVYIAQLISRPLQSLRKATRIAAMGKYDTQSPVLTNDEIGDLTVDFNKMLQDLGKLEAMKSEFVSHITHDLKSPIATIKQALELLVSRAAGPLTPEQERIVSISLSSQRRLNDLVSDILDTAKLESGTFKLNLEPMEVVAFLDEVTTPLLPQMQAKKVWLTKQIYFKRLELRADKSQLARVLTNLLANAIKFTPDGGRITVEAEDEGHQVKFSVIDTGPGIPQQELTNIFKKFYQVEGSGTKQKGSGLGLSIAKQLVELHGGTIWAESDLRYGTAFFFTLPKSGSVGSPAVMR